ncbi:MAG: DNA-binding protein [Phycisphaerae bacterium]|nr:DNA-binding protein [Phycisphaerae bacterium]
MAKKRVYVESSVISYLTAKPARNELNTMRQRQTVLWWERRHEWDCVVSAIVMAEIVRGDPGAAARRLETAQSLVKLPALPEAALLARLLLSHELVPESVGADAAHLAIAAVHRADYLLTWNQKHLDNLHLRSRVEDFIRKQGWRPAMVITPERLLLEEPT